LLNGLFFTEVEARFVSVNADFEFKGKLRLTKEIAPVMQLNGGGINEKQ
jgi:hypothetical protein